MKFLLDANMKKSVGTFLESSGHSVRYLAGTEDRGLPDDQVLKLAFTENRILITNDKDFGDLIYRQHHPHCGVILFRLTQATDEGYIRRLLSILQSPEKDIVNRYIVITDDHIRVR